MVTASSSPFQALWWGASIAAHAIVFTTMGHAPATTPTSTDAPIGLTIDVEAPATPALPDDPPALAAVARTASNVAPPTHTHPYPVAPDHDAVPHDPSLVHLPWAPPAAAPLAPADAVVATPSAPAHFTMAVTNVPAVGHADGAATAAADPVEPGSDAAPLPEVGVTSSARVLGAVSPLYPSAARAQGVEADVVLALVVSTAGDVRDARVVQPAGHGFDEAAVHAVRTARFSPALLRGRAVAVRMRWTVSFRLQ